jgi:nicotinamide mononucleotide transporter
VIYIVLEIRQKNLMWVVGIATSLAAMWVFFRQGLYASFGLNTYYLVASFAGLWQWRRDRNKVSSAVDKAVESTVVHLNRLNVRIVAVSVAAVVAGTYALSLLMEHFENPMSYLDSFVAVLSAVATLWLVRSYIEQWWLWLLADATLAVLCGLQGLWWMALLYAVYTLSCVYGFWHWKKHGLYVSEKHCKSI